MKILITTDTYFPVVNGVITSINNLYAELKNSGHEVKILTLSHTGEEKIIDDIYYLRSIKIGIYPDARIKVPFRNKLISELLEWKPDIVHSQTEFSTLLPAKYISNKLGIPHIHTYHTMYEDYLGYLPGGKMITKRTAAKIIKFLLNSVDAIIAPTDKTKKALQSYGIFKDMYVIPTGIDLKKFQKDITVDERNKILSKFGLSGKDKIVTFIGRTAKEKNIDEIIALFKEVINEVPNAKLLVVGAGPELNNLKELVSMEGLDNSVYFTGMVNPEDIYKYYKLSEVFVTASCSETQGLTYIEALASGCPIVCKWDQCIEGLIVQGENGYAYKKQWEFSYHLIKILKNEDLRKNMSKAALNIANQYSSTTFKEKILDAYCTSIYLSEGKTYIV